MSSVQLIQDSDAVPEEEIVSLGHISHASRSVRDVGIRKVIPESCFSMTNHVIKEISGYLPSFWSKCF